MVAILNGNGESPKINMRRLNQIVAQLSEWFQSHQLMLVTAESCTGGWVAQTVTAMSGSSLWFERGFVTYSNPSKQALLGVKQTTLARYGAVSKQTAIEMAEGALKNSLANVSLAVTGIAGPEGGQADKPVGTVYFAWAGDCFKTQVEKKHFTGDRQAVREKTVHHILAQLLHILQTHASEN